MSNLNYIAYKLSQAANVVMSTEKFKNNRGKIRIADFEVPDGWVGHHLIPIQLRYAPICLKAYEAGWDINSYYTNGMALPYEYEDSQLANLPHHRGSHSNYTSYVERLLNDLNSRSQSEEWDIYECKSQVERLVIDLGLKIFSMGGDKPVDDIY